MSKGTMLAVRAWPPSLEKASLCITEITSVVAAVSVTGDVDTKKPARLVMASPYVDTESVSREEAEQALDTVLQHVFAKYRRSV